jgi:hypothetical protein
VNRNSRDKIEIIIRYSLKELQGTADPGFGVTDVPSAIPC